MSPSVSHPYAIQDAAFFIALIPIVLLFVIMGGAAFFDGLRRARKPAPSRTPGALINRRLQPISD